MEETKKEYEISFLLASPEAEKGLADILAKNGAEVFYKKPAVELRLAYKIKKHVSAYFGFYHFRANADVIKSLSDALTLAAGVIRFLIITPPVKLASEPTQQQPASAPARAERKPSAPILSNEALSEKLEEILK
jgi:ribosomal protein S6